MKQRSPVRRISEKRLKSLKGKPCFSTIAPSGKGVKRKPRKPSETLRIYGPPARRKLVKSMPCAACRYDGKPSEQAHVAPKGEKGTGYKADAKWIVPFCAPHLVVDVVTWEMHDYIGCHRLFDRYRSDFDERFPDFNAVEAARKTEQSWLEHSGETKCT